MERKRQVFLNESQFSIILGIILLYYTYSINSNGKFTCTVVIYNCDS